MSWTVLSHQKFGCPASCLITWIITLVLMLSRQTLVLKLILGKCGRDYAKKQVVMKSKPIGIRKGRHYLLYLLQEFYQIFFHSALTCFELKSKPFYHYFVIFRYIVIFLLHFTSTRFGVCFLRCWSCFNLRKYIYIKKRRDLKWAPCMLFSYLRPVMAKLVSSLHVLQMPLKTSHITSVKSHLLA